MIPERAVQEIQDFCNRIKYKYGFKIRAHLSSWMDAVELTFLLPVPSREWDDTTIANTSVEKWEKIIIRSALPLSTLYRGDSLDKKLLFDVVYNRIKEMELHEVDEWFLFDGKRIFEPHDSDVRTGRQLYMNQVFTEKGE